MKTTFRSCTLCEAICGLEIREENGKIVSIRGDKDDVFSHGHICPKGPELKAILEDPDRLKKPMRRTANGWQTISWNDATSEVAERFHEIRHKHGLDSIAYYAGNPNVHNYGSLLFGPRFIGKLKTRNFYSATSVDQLPHHFASLYMFGHPFLLPIPDIDRTQYFLVMGANPLASNGSIMTAPDMKGRMKAVQERGGKIVVIDPRKTETAEKANEHFFIRPGTDALFLLSLLNVIFNWNRTQKTELHAFVDGMDTIASLVKEFAPDVTATRTGIPADVTKRIALEFADAKSAVCYGRVGLSTQSFGGICQWLINVLNIVTGNFDRAVGAMFPLPAVDTISAEGKRKSYGTFDTFRSKARNLPEFNGELPVAVLAYEILFEGEGRIRGLFTAAGNPVLSTPNGHKLDGAMKKLDFMASLDFYLNETTCNSNIILPPTSPLEHDHYDIVFNLFAVRNTARYSPAVVDPEPGTMHDWQIFSELTSKLELARNPGAKPKSEARSKLTPNDFLDRLLKSGPYGSQRELSVEILKQNPHGIDFGPMAPQLPERLRTEDKRIKLAPEIITQDLKRLKAVKTNGKHTANEFMLIGRRTVRDNNSWMHNVPKLMAGKARCTLFMNPADATRLGLSDGQMIAAKSAVGAIELPLEIAEEIMPGVVSIPHGYGHGRAGTRMATASQHAGASINDLTDERLLDDLTGNAAFSGVPVEISAMGK